MTHILRSEASLSAPASGSAQRRLRARFGRAGVFATQVALVIVFISLWQAAISNGWINPFFFGAPFEIYSAFAEWIADGSLFMHAAITLMEAFVGFAIAVIVAVPAGIALARSEFWGRVFHPFIDMANSTPRFALAPLFVLFFGLGATTKIVLVFSVVFFVMLINTIAGANSVDPNHIRFARLVGVSTVQLYSKVILPATARWLIAGMRISVPYSIAAAVVGEMISANRGLGFLVVKYAGLLETSKVLAAVFVLAIGGWALNAVLGALLKKLPWVD